MTSRSMAARSQGSRRLDSIDFWRGLVLCTIFVNHVPGNLFEPLTFRNYGFSDSAEAFVFISGLALALSYGRKFAAGRDGEAIRSLGRRAAKLYGVHLGLTVVGLAIFAAGAVWFDNDVLMQPHGRDLVVEDPAAALLGIASLGHQFGYFNILPLYVVLVGFAPVLFLLARWNLPAMLAFSAAVYAVARLTGLNIPTWPMKGGWFFDPFAWQLLMAMGIASGLLYTSGALPRISRSAVALAALVLAGGLVCATNAFGTVPGLYDQTRGWADLDKTMLGLGRLVHFFSLATVVAGLGLARIFARLPLYRPLCLIGRQGLSSFVIVSLLAAAGQVLTLSFGHSPAMDLLIVGGGLGLLYAAARMVRRFDDPVPVLAAPVALLRSAGRLIH